MGGGGWMVGWSVDVDGRFAEELVGQATNGNHTTTVNHDDCATKPKRHDDEIKIFPKFISQIFYFYSDARPVWDQCGHVVIVSSNCDRMSFATEPAQTNGKTHKVNKNGKTHKVNKNGKTHKVNKNGKTHKVNKNGKTYKVNKNGKT
jgi:hypothetical protein